MFIISKFEKFKCIVEDLNNLNNDLKFVIDLCRIVILIYCLEKIFKVWIKNFFVVKKIIYR